MRDPFYGCTARRLPELCRQQHDELRTAAQEALLNIIPTARLDPNAVSLLGVYPDADRSPG